MIQIDEFSGKSVAVLGLGRTGLSAVRSLLAGGANVFAWDDHLPARQHAKEEGFELCDLSRRDMSDLAALVLSPGIEHTFPKPNHIVKLARACGIPIIGDVELLARKIGRLNHDKRPKIVGITGTNGKSTTTALVAHILRSADICAHEGGNIGRACLDLPAPNSKQVYVLELSSYQLELTNSLHCDVACLLNLSPDHLIRHGGMENYISAKKRVFANQTNADLAVCGVDGAQTVAFVSELMLGSAKFCSISASTCLSRGVYVLGAKLMDARGTSLRQVTDLSDASGLQGRHNWQNAAAAYAITSHLGVSEQDIIKALHSFSGLAHRMEPLGELQNIQFVNDSKATNGQAAARALASFSNIYWIAGGQAKEDGLDPVFPFIDRVSKAYLIGQAANEFAATLSGRCDVETCKQLEQAFAAAFADAKKAINSDPVILLSPACASFDQFKSFEERGEVFRQLLQNAKDSS